MKKELNQNSSSIDCVEALSRGVNEVSLEPARPVVLEQGVGCESSIYGHRFSEAQENVRAEVWKVLVPEFLQRFVSPDDAVLDLGAGDGHFLLNVCAGRRIAVDLSEHVLNLARYGIETIQASATEFSSQLSTPVDLIFISNFFEHLPHRRLVFDVLTQCRQSLRIGGKVLILQPNIRYVGPAYWDYIDHHIGLTEHSLQEALEVSGFKILQMIPRFLPYTAKSGLGRIASGKFTKVAVRAYLKFPLAWRIFGGQTFIVATREC